jgi:hypothetical protein
MVKIMPRKVSKTRAVGLLVSGLSVFALAGCSTLSDGVDAVGKGVVYIGESVETATSDVTVVKVDEDIYALSETFYEPVKSLDSWAMRIEAREACPKGYVYLSRNARKTGGFAYSEVQCEGEMSCAFNLEWRIKCQDVPDEPFSLFGKT